MHYLVMLNEKVNNAAKEVDEKSSLIHSKEIDMLVKTIIYMY